MDCDAWWTILKKSLNMLIVFICHVSRHSRLLYPTLISACYQLETNRELLEQEISCKLLVAFLQENISMEASTKSARGSIKDQETTAATDEGVQKAIDFGSLFEHRFPKAHWPSAVSFFTR